MAGGRQLYRPVLPTQDAPWTVVARQDVGQLVAAPASVGARPTARLVGTSNAAALASRLGAQYAHTIDDVISRGGNGESLKEVPMAVLLKALLIHTAEWRTEAFGFAKEALCDWIDPSRAKDELAGVLGYGVLRGDRGLGCSPERATAIGGSRIAKGERFRHTVPIASSLHLYRNWRRVTITLAWFSPINAGNRKYRVARLGLDLPSEKATPLGVKASQVHSDTTTRGTVQHVVLERRNAVVSVGDQDEFEFFVTCAEDAGSLDHPVPYGVAVTLEVEPGRAIYSEVAQRLAQRVPVPAKAR